MKNKLILLLLLIFSSITTLTASEHEIYIACAGGYKLPVKELILKFEQQTGIKVNAIYGNMKTITTYINQSAKIAMIIGDKNYIHKSRINLITAHAIGTGKLLLVYQPTLSINNITDLTSNDITRIGIPDPKNAIYGKAAIEFLKNNKLYEIIKKKLFILKTVPQVSSYLKSGNIEVGLINITDYQKLQSSNLKTLQPDPKSYNEITIQIGLINKQGKKFYDFLLSINSLKVFRKYGL